MVRTAELRWFVEGPPPPALAEWFAARAGTRTRRVDRYLRLPGTDALGVKLRGDGRRLELKLREQQRPAEGLPGGAEGQAEVWQKWSLGRRPWAVVMPRLGVAADRWTEVLKQRRTVTFSWSPQGGATLTDVAPACGCRAELAAVGTADGGWSSLGLEAFGPDDLLDQALAASAEVLLSAVGPVAQLTAARSYGYPGWLARSGC